MRFVFSDGPPQGLSRGRSGDKASPDIAEQHRGIARGLFVFSQDASRILRPGGQ